MRHESERIIDEAYAAYERPNYDTQDKYAYSFDYASVIPPKDLEDHIVPRLKEISGVLWDYKEMKNKAQKTKEAQKGCEIEIKYSQKTTWGTVLFQIVHLLIIYIGFDITLTKTDIFSEPFYKWYGCLYTNVAVWLRGKLPEFFLYHFIAIAGCIIVALLAGALILTVFRWIRKIYNRPKNRAKIQQLEQEFQKLDKEAEDFRNKHNKLLSILPKRYQTFMATCQIISHLEDGTARSFRDAFFYAEEFYKRPAVAPYAGGRYVFNGDYVYVAYSDGYRDHILYF